jgi:hypothetical protein
MLLLGNLESELESRTETECLIYYFRLKCGSMEWYDKSYDRVNVRNERPLQPVDRIIHTVTTSDDPVIRKVRAHKF